MADPVQKPKQPESESFFEHVRSFFVKGAKGDAKEIVEKGGPGGQTREQKLMSAVDDAISGAKDANPDY